MKVRFFTLLYMTSDMGAFPCTCNKMPYLFGWVHYTAHCTLHNAPLSPVNASSHWAHDVGAILNQRHLRWFNLAATSCTWREDALTDKKGNQGCIVLNCIGISKSFVMFLCGGRGVVVWLRVAVLFRILHSGVVGFHRMTSPEFNALVMVAYPTNNQCCTNAGLTLWTRCTDLSVFLWRHIYRSTDISVWN